MDINSILKGGPCRCGRTHECSLEEVRIGSGILLELKELCAHRGAILLVADENTDAAAGKKVAEILKESILRKVIFPAEPLLIPNEEAITSIEEALEGVELILGVGSGVIQDLCKYVSFFHQIPYGVVATAPSMDGYTSTGAAMILKGMKETVSADLPRFIVADTAVLKEAPFSMIQAGYGDIVGKFSALSDWRLAEAVNGEYLCPEIYRITMEAVEETLAAAEGIAARREESIRILVEALIAVGIMMSFAGSSRPASGSEHHLSHFFEIVGIVKNEPYLAHGIDVAYASVVTAALREELAEKPFPSQPYRHERAQYEAEVRRLYGEKVGNGCIALQDRTGNYLRDRYSVYLAKEKEIREILKSAPTAKEMEAYLAPLSLSFSDFRKFYGEEKIRDAVRYGKELKDRYSVLWMYYDLFGGKKEA